jgi:cyclophilin family peptidyl-prolyl cis-trans isomerase
MRIDNLSAIRPQLIAALLLCPLTAVWAQTTDNTPASELEAVVTTELGTFRIEFAPDKAPKHVENFIKLAREGYYNNSGFFRVGRAYIQGGDPLLKDPTTEKKSWGSGGLDLLTPEYSDMSHIRGVVSTYHTFKHKDGAQFFIMVTDQPSFDHGFSAFGRVTQGMDIVDKINSVPRDPENNYVFDVVRIKTVTIEKKKAVVDAKKADVVAPKAKN